MERGQRSDRGGNPAHGRAVTALAAVMLLAPGLALAQPRLVPAGDVTVLYTVGGAAAEQIPGGAPRGVQLQWDASGGRLRTDPVGAPLYAITDLANRTAELVFPAQKSVLELPLKGGDPQALLAGADARFTRRGAGHALGMACTEWAIHARHADGTGCVTPDGIVLRAEGMYDGRSASMTAVSVTRGAVPADAFALPASYFRLPLGMKR